MSYALIANTFGVSADGGASAVTGDIDTTGANLLVVNVAKIDNTTITLADSKGNAWAPLTEYAASFSSSTRLYYCLNPTVGSGHTFSVTALTGTPYPSLYAAAFSGAAASSVFDVENGAASLSAGSLASGSITPSLDNELVISGMNGGSASGPYSVDSSFAITDQATLGGGQHFGGGLAYKIQTSAAAVNPTWTQGTTTAIAVTVASFKVAATTGGGPLVRPSLLNSALLRGGRLI